MAGELRAIIEWTDEGAVVKIAIAESFELPPRTAVDLDFPIPRGRKPPGTIEETTLFISTYKCMDCDFKTESLEIMLQHQKTAKHSLWRRIKRLLGL